MGDSPQENQAEKSREAAFRAVEEQKSGRDTFLSDPLFGAIRQISEQIAASPLTFGPDQRRDLYNRQASVASNEANQFLAESRAGLSANGPGIRSGSALNAEFEIGSRLGEALAESRRQTELFGAQQDRADLVNAQQIAQVPLDIVRSFSDAIAASELGNAGFIAQGAQGAARTTAAGGLANQALGAGGTVGAAALGAK